MCGIVGAIAERNIVPILMEGLRRLEYRGYDSAGIAIVDDTHHLTRLRAVGKVQALQNALDLTPCHGMLGIAHTRWATHGVPSERNAHPHISGDGLAIVHNGIIENHETLRVELEREGYTFSSETDTEVIAHRIHYYLKSAGDLFKAVRSTAAELQGAYALAVVSERDPDRMILAREGCPVVIGLGVEENFVASDVAALLPVTRRFMFLEEGDVAEIRRTSVRIVDRKGNSVERVACESELSADAAEKGQFRHFMLKEIHEQPRAVADTLQERVASGHLLEAAFGPTAAEIFRRVESVHIVACGTSHHAGAVARYFIEQICRLPCVVEIASEYRYRNPLVPRNSLFVTISQSGEIVAWIRSAGAAAPPNTPDIYQQFAILQQVPESSLVRESDLVMLTLERAPRSASPRPRPSPRSSASAGHARNRPQLNIMVRMPSASAAWSPVWDRAACTFLEQTSSQAGSLAAKTRGTLRRQAPCPVPRTWRFLHPDRHGSGRSSFKEISY